MVEDEVNTDEKLTVSFMKVPMVMVFDRRLTSGDREVYSLLMHMARIFKKVYPSQTYLEEITGLKRTAIQSHLRKLRDIGLIKTSKAGFSGNNQYELVALETVYTPEKVKAAKRLPTKGSSEPVARKRSIKNLDVWWNSLDPVRKNYGAQLCAIRNKRFSFDSREIRRLKQFLYTATLLFDSTVLHGPATEWPKDELAWVAEHPIDVVTKPGSRVTVDGSPRSILALAAKTEVACGGNVAKFEDSGLVAVRSATNIQLLEIQSALDRLAGV